ncbi:hypothetical protein IF650_19665 [Cellulosimicrobium terreum]|nr:hypothetical protein [Cellulosimicrobium terreum]
MTYGEVTTDLHNALADLLSKKRVLARLDERAEVGRSWHAPGSPQAQEAAGVLIQRYRAVVLLWQRDILDAAVPPGHRGPQAAAGPMVEAARLLERVDHAIGRARPIDGGRFLASSDELGAKQPLPLVEQWRCAAVVAMRGREQGLGWVSPETHRSERAALISDVCRATRALVVLDARYQRVPGWRAMVSPPELDPITPVVTRASAWAKAVGADYGIDQQGHRPRPSLVEDVDVPGAAGALLAARNGATHLARQIPSGLALQEIVVINEELSRRAADLMVSRGLAGRSAVLASFPDVGPDHGFAEMFAERAEMYRSLAGALVNVDGRAGAGGRAVAAFETALARARDAHFLTTAQADRLAETFRATDVRISRALQVGAREGLYFVAGEKTLSRAPARGGVMIAQPAWERITSETHPELLGLARELRPGLQAAMPSPDAVLARSRVEAGAATLWDRRVASKARGRPSQGFTWPERAARLKDRGQLNR